MDTHTLASLRSQLYSTEALYKRSGRIAELQWRIGHNRRFEIYYTTAAGASEMLAMDHAKVMENPDTAWLTDELNAAGIHMILPDAERIIQQYAIATTANWHPLLPKLNRGRVAA